MTDPVVLAIDPGSTSTKLALYRGADLIKQTNLIHSPQELKPFMCVADQLAYRLAHLHEWLRGLSMWENAIGKSHQSAVGIGGGGGAGNNLNAVIGLIDVVVGRGGFLHPVASGTYSISADMLAELKEARYGEHASNLGALLAHAIAEPLGIPACIVDPIVVDEFEPEARISGLPLIFRKSQLHALNIRAVARRVADQLGQELGSSHFIVAHLGSGISVAAMREGRLIDVNNANNGGPFSAERAGGLPTIDLIQLCYSGRYEERDLINLVTKGAGLQGYLGSKDLREIEERIAGGDEYATQVLDAMAYQVAKEIGAMATVLAGRVQRIILTGGMAYSKMLTTAITRRVQFLAPISIVPGEGELEALATAGVRVFQHKEQPLHYLSGDYATNSPSGAKRHGL